MPHIFIDGLRIEAKDGQTVIEAAQQAGIIVPHFCWHPGLSVSGNCRMCLCEVGTPKRNRDGSIELDSDGNPAIGYIPKLQIGCGTTISDGMYVNLNSQKTVHAQEAVMEFILINHPLDCPICDEAGQCKLQEYGLKHSKGESRFDETKNHKYKRTSLGPNVLFDGERCISCSRCIRFADEIAKQPNLTFIQRGDKVTVGTFPDTEFDSPYSMNVIDICPVGALTSPDFRFRARVWDMSFNDSICPGCSQGCNIKVGVRNNEILRLEPRTNMSVNEYWMCDRGRLNEYKSVNQNRIDKPLLKKDGAVVETEWKDAMAFAASKLKSFKPQEIYFVASPNATNEDNFALQKLAKQIGANSPVFFQHNDPTFGDNLLRRSDRSPNVAGLLALGLHHIQNVDSIVSGINSGTIKALYILDENLAAISAEATKALSKVPLLIVHASNHNETTKLAHVIFSSATYAEIDGTFTNFKQRVQHLAPAVVTVENERTMGMKMSRLDKFGAQNDRWSHGERRNCKQSWRAIQMLAGLSGAKWNFKESKDVFEEISKHNNGFAGMTYDLLDERMGIILGKANVHEEQIVQYQSHTLKPN